ncbi:YbhB/YbcL family Raf kinase inhibitor-like protein [Halobacteriales archaeon QS_5_70_15]|nr:MAG: YbhB/YbcL family Raf kinase inhibitor-like protein [Halobacteriales archaeon QS_5_70_15]
MCGDAERGAVPTRRDLIAAAALAAAPLAGCAGNGGDAGTSPGAAVTVAPDPGTPALEAPTLASPAFGDGEPIPEEYTCSGADRSPPLSVSAVPPEAETLALVMDDPDAGATPYVHWLVWGVPVDRTEWPAGVPEGRRVDELGGAQGTNSRGTVGYVGPCPPPDDGAHTYRFGLYALGSSLGLDPGAERSAVESAIGDARYGVATLRGTYDR